MFTLMTGGTRKTIEIVDNEEITKKLLQLHTTIRLNITHMGYVVIQSGARTKTEVKKGGHGVRFAIPQAV